MLLMVILFVIKLLAQANIEVLLVFNIFVNCLSPHIQKSKKNKLIIIGLQLILVGWHIKKGDHSKNLLKKLPMTISIG